MFGKKSLDITAYAQNVVAQADPLLLRKELESVRRAAEFASQSHAKPEIRQELAAKQRLLQRTIEDNRKLLRKALDRRAA